MKETQWVSGMKLGVRCTPLSESFWDTPYTTKFLNALSCVFSFEGDNPRKEDCSSFWDCFAQGLTNVGPIVL